MKAKDGEWMNAPPIDGTLVVIVSDIAEIWTDGFCHSVTHRVTKPTTSDRYSVVAFVDPCLECVVIPGDAKGDSNHKMAERLSITPFKVENYLTEYYKKILK